MRPGERVLTAAGEYKQVAARIDHYYSGPLYHVRVKCFGELKATPEHPFIAVRRTWGRHKHNSEFREEKVEAANLRVGDYVVFPVMQKVVDMTTFPISFTKKVKDTRSKPLPRKWLSTPTFSACSATTRPRGARTRGRSSSASTRMRSTWSTT